MPKKEQYSYPPRSSNRKGFLEDLQAGQSGLNINEAQLPTMKFLKRNCRLSAMANDNPPTLMRWEKSSHNLYCEIWKFRDIPSANYDDPWRRLWHGNGISEWAGEYSLWKFLYSLERSKIYFIPPMDSRNEHCIALDCGTRPSEASACI